MDLCLFPVALSSFGVSAEFFLKLMRPMFPFPSSRFRAKRKAFTRYSKKWQDASGKADIERDLAKIKKYCSVIRVVAHTQVRSRQSLSRSIDLGLD